MLLRVRLTTTSTTDLQLQLTTTPSSSSPPFYRKGKYPAKGISASSRWSQDLDRHTGLYLGSVLFGTALCCASSRENGLRLDAVIKPQAVCSSRPLGEGWEVPPGLHQSSISSWRASTFLPQKQGDEKSMGYGVRQTFHFPREWFWTFHFPRESYLTFGASVSDLKSGAYVTFPRILWGLETKYETHSLESLVTEG